MKIKKELITAIEDYVALVLWIVTAIWLARNGRKHPILTLLGLTAVGKEISRTSDIINDDDAVEAWYDAIGVEVEDEPEKEEAPIMGFH